MRAFTRFIVAFGILGWPAMGICQGEIPCDRVWDLGVWAAVTTGEENTNSLAESQILSAGPFVGRVVDPHAGHGWWAGNIEYGLSVSPLFLQVRPQHLYGIAFEPIILRWNSTHELGRVIPYIELAGGALRSNVNLPAGNTSNFNVTASGGAGFYLRSKSGRAWDLGARWDHISNANLGIQNPEFNGIQVRLAYHWYH